MATLGPFLIDIDASTTDPISATGWPGPYYHGSDIFASILNDADVGHLFKSTDHGQTWVEGAAGPTGSRLWTLPGPTATTLRTFTDENAGLGNRTWTIGEWDLVTETWALVVQTVFPAYAVYGYDYNPVTGVDYVYFALAGGGSHDVTAKPYNGAWGVDLNIGDHFDPLKYGFLGTSKADPLGVTHVVYGEGLAGVYTTYYRQISALGALEAPVVLPVGTALYSSPSVGYISFTGTYVVIPYREPTPPGPLWAYKRTAVWSGTNYTTPAPVFTSTTISTNYLGDGLQSALGLDGLAYLWWFEATTPALDDLDQLVYCSFDGVTPGAITLFYDAIADDPFPWVPFQFLHSLSVPANVSVTEWNVIARLEYIPPGGQGPSLCADFFWYQMPTPPPPPPC